MNKKIIKKIHDRVSIPLTTKENIKHEISYVTTYLWELRL